VSKLWRLAGEAAIFHRIPVARWGHRGLRRASGSRYTLAPPALGRVSHSASTWSRIAKT
jgi:hypothetical protein